MKMMFFHVGLLMHLVDQAQQPIPKKRKPPRGGGGIPAFFSKSGKTPTNPPTHPQTHPRTPPPNPGIVSTSHSAMACVQLHPGSVCGEGGGGGSGPPYCNTNLRRMTVQHGG